MMAKNFYCLCLWFKDCSPQNTEENAEDNSKISKLQSVLSAIHCKYLSGRITPMNT